MTPDGGVLEVAAQEAVVGRCGEEFNGFASVVTACETWFAGETGDVGFDCYAVARFEGSDRGVCG